MTKKRPEVLEGKTIKCKTNCGAFYLTLNYNEKELYEVRMMLGKSGNCIKSLLEINSILLSILLQTDLPKEKLVKVIERYLLEMKCGEPFVTGGVKYHSCLDFVAKKVLGELKKDDPAPK